MKRKYKRFIKKTAKHIIIFFIGTFTVLGILYTIDNLNFFWYKHNIEKELENYQTPFFRYDFKYYQNDSNFKGDSI